MDRDTIHQATLNVFERISWWKSDPQAVKAKAVRMTHASLDKGKTMLCPASYQTVKFMATEYDKDSVCALCSQAIIRETTQEAICIQKCICRKCGTPLNHFSGLEMIPEYDYCPQCEDFMYDTMGKVIGKLE